MIKKHGKTRRSGTGLDEAKELGRLTGMYSYFSKSIDFQGGEYGVAILTRFPIIAQEHYALPMPDSTGEPRSVAIVRLEVLPGIKIEFASTHLDLKSENRMAQVNELINISKASQYPFILSGDFNSQPGDKEIKTLQQEFTFGCTSNCPLTFPSDKPAVAIDYIVLNPNAANILKISDYEAVGGTTASDHLPLMSTLKKQ